MMRCTQTRLHDSNFFNAHTKSLQNASNIKMAVSIDNCECYFIDSIFFFRNSSFFKFLFLYISPGEINKHMKYIDII